MIPALRGDSNIPRHSSTTVAEELGILMAAIPEDTLSRIENLSAAATSLGTRLLRIDIKNLGMAAATPKASASL